MLRKGPAWVIEIGAYHVRRDQEDMRAFAGACPFKWAGARARIGKFKWRRVSYFLREGGGRSTSQDGARSYAYELSAIHHILSAPEHTPNQGLM